MALTFSPLNTCDGALQLADGTRQKEDGLAVRLTSFCSERCPYCIASESMQDHRRQDVAKMVKATLATPARRVLIIGGEPLLFLDACLAYASAVAPSLEAVHLTTSLPITVERQWAIFSKLMDHLQMVNVSLQATDQVVNSRIMNSKKPYLRRMETLERMVQEWPEKVTVILNLTQGGLDSREAVLNALDDLNDRGVRSVRLNELQKAPESFVCFENLFPEVELPSPFAGGCHTYLEDFYPGMKVKVKRSCFLVERSLGATEEDLQKLLYREAHPQTFEWQDTNVVLEDGSSSLYWGKARSLDAPSSPPPASGCGGCSGASPTTGPVALGMPALPPPRNLKQG